MATMAHQILHHPDPVGEIGRVVRMMDRIPAHLPNGEISPEVKAAIAQAREWAETPCCEAMQPVQDVLRVLLGYIGGCSH